MKERKKENNIIIIIFTACHIQIFVYHLLARHLVSQLLKVLREKVEETLEKLKKKKSQKIIKKNKTK